MKRILEFLIKKLPNIGSITGWNQIPTKRSLLLIKMDMWSFLNEGSLKMSFQELYGKQDKRKIDNLSIVRTAYQRAILG